MTKARITPKIAAILTRVAAGADKDTAVVGIEDGHLLHVRAAVDGEQYSAAWRWTGRTWRLYFCTDGWNGDKMNLTAWLSFFPE